jgi:hypothetical protein
VRKRNRRNIERITRWDNMDNHRDMYRVIWETYRVSPNQEVVEHLEKSS